MGRDYHFHCELADCSVTAGVHLGGVRELELLVNGKQVAFERVHGHHAQVRTLTAALPTATPRPVAVRMALPGPVRGEPACVLVDGDVEQPMPARQVRRVARLTEASWYS